MENLSYKFQFDQFACKHCGENKTNLAFFSRLQDALLYLTFTPTVNSGYRCPEHNAAVGSKAPEHPAGLAADLGVVNGQQRIELAAALLRAGFLRLGVASAFIHVDVYPAVSSLWLYSPKTVNKAKIA